MLEGCLNSGHTQRSPDLFRTEEEKNIFREAQKASFNYFWDGTEPTSGLGREILEKIVKFLETADRFHGAWPHWWNGETGKVKPFGRKDNGKINDDPAYNDGIQLGLNHQGNAKLTGSLFWAHYSYSGIDPRGLKKIGFSSPYIK